MKTLTFADPVFDDGLAYQLTVRVGIKLTDHVGKIVAFRDAQGRDVGSGRIVWVQVIQFGYLGDRDLEHEHNPLARMVTGLRRRMSKHYGKKICDDQVVSVIAFTRGS